MVLLDGATGAHTGNTAGPQISSTTLTESDDRQITIRASSPDIAPYQQKQLKVTSQSLQVDIIAQRLISFLNIDNIVVSEPSTDGKVYVSGVAGAVADSITSIADIKIVTISNLRTGEKSSGQVNNDGGFTPIMVEANIGDQLELSLNCGSESLGALLYSTVMLLIPPKVILLKPTNGDKDIVIDIQIKVYFSEPVQQSTVNNNSFTLTDSIGNIILGSIGFLDTVATFDPTDPLAPNTSYIITVTTDVADLQGLHLESAYTATFTTEAQGMVINVPADVPTIQAGIDAATDGDTVLVADGAYLENINFKGKAITVASHYLVDGDTSHINNTIIDGSQPSNPDSGSTVFFISGEDTTSVIYGFTITGGTGTSTQFIWYGEVRPTKAGGGVFCFHSGARILRNKITDNNISYDEESVGGGVAGFPVGNTGFVIVEDNQIVNNTLTGHHSHGPAICLTCNGSIINNDISGNSGDATQYAHGAVNCFTESDKPRNVVIQNNYITHNTSTGNDYALGGGVCLGGTGSGYGMGALVLENEISHNNLNASAYGEGGGIYVNGVSEEVSINKNTISGNNVIGANISSGGGIYIQDNISGSTFITSNIIASNVAKEGGGIYSYFNGKAVIINNTIVNNTASDGGGGIKTNGITSVIVNTIFWNNHAPVKPQISGSVEVRFSDIEGGYSGTGNIDSDPQFLDTLSYNLSDASPCIGAGIDSIQIGGVWYTAPTEDGDGNPRPNPPGSTPDMGAMESVRAIPEGNKTR